MKDRELLKSDHPVVGREWRLLGEEEVLRPGDEVGCVNSLLSLIVPEDWTPIYEPHEAEYPDEIVTGMMVAQTRVDDMDADERVFRRRREEESAAKLRAKLQGAEERAAKAEQERDARDEALSTALWDLDRARKALGSFGHESGDVALGIGVLRELYKHCGQYLNAARQERDEAWAGNAGLRRRLKWASREVHDWNEHGGSWATCKHELCSQDRAVLGMEP